MSFNEKDFWEQWSSQFGATTDSIPEFESVSAKPTIGESLKSLTRNPIFWAWSALAAATLLEEKKVKKAFISFDYDNDEILRTFLVGQAKHPDTPFEIIDRSIKEHLTGDWKAKARGRIQRADVVVVICGQYTHLASGVAAELAIAKELGKPYFLLKGYSNKTCTKPTSAAWNDSVYPWTWENLKILIDGGR